MQTVRPAEVQLTLANGARITVRRRLNVREQREMYADVITFNRATGEVVRNPLELPRATICAYLLDWTVTDDRGELVTIRDHPRAVPDKARLDAVLDELDPDDYADLLATIDAHIGREKDRREVEKKTRSGNANADPISNSPSEPVGVSTGSGPLTPTITPPSWNS